MAATFYNTFENKAILIPRLQRDYVQGLNVALISDFIERLVYSVQEGKNEDLNYIYGRWVDDGSKYIPIDGQQRLTTLWLLHLYSHSASLPQNPFPVSIIFESREHAQSFCDCLKRELGGIIKSCPQGRLCQQIVNQAWFQRIWLKDRTVKSMLSALDVIRTKIKGVDISSFNEKLKSTESITFKFYKIDGKLNDDVYIKMNGRGLPLTDFEILKSWLDGKIEEVCHNNLSWLQLWQNNLDNSWTELIWKNRNLDEKDSIGNDISFLIDDEFLRFFYNLILIYWLLLKVNHHQKKSDICGIADEQSDSRLNDIGRLLNMEKDVEKEEFPEMVYDRLMNRFIGDGEYYLPLYLLDKTNIFTPRLLVFIYTAFQELVQSQSIPEKEWLFGNRETLLNFHVGATSSKTIFHQIALEDKPTYKNLCLLYASLKPLSKKEGSATSFFDWMRVMRNLILGTNITKENISRVLKSIHDFSALCKKKNIYELLADGILREDSSGFNQSQFEEEIKKAQWIIEDSSWAQVFNNFENTAFCKSTIGFIFGYLPEQRNIKIFREYSTLFHLLFGESGVRYNIQDGFILQRSLMCFTSHYGFGYSYGDNKDYKWKFMDNRDEWHKFLKDSVEYEGQPHNQCMKTLLFLLYERLHNQIDLSNYNEEYVQVLVAELDLVIKGTLQNNTIKDWRYYFIKYPSVWTAMGKSLCYWVNDYNIMILGSTQYRGGNIRELHSFAFMKDVEADKEEHPKKYNNWNNLGFWYYDNTCMYIDHNCMTKRIVRIDLFYELDKADQYRFRLFYLPNKNEESEVTYQATFNDLLPIAEKHSFKFQELDHKYYSSCYSYEDAVLVFNELLKELESY